jgi:RecB family exonuclease
VLERVLSELGSAVTPDTLPDAIRLLDEAMRELGPTLAVGRSEALRRAAAEAIAADLRRYLHHEASHTSGWDPRALELRFGFDDEEESWPPLVLAHDGETVAVRGAIDRVDVEPGTSRAAVRDYKSGASRTVHQGSRWRSDQQLQVALYMVAVRELLGLEPVAGLYQPLGGKDLRPRGIYLEDAPVQSGLFPRDGRDLEGLESELEDACRRALGLAGALRRGELEPSPETCSRDGCRYPGICRAQ